MRKPNVPVIVTIGAVVVVGVAAALVLGLRLVGAVLGDRDSTGADTDRETDDDVPQDGAPYRLPRDAEPRAVITPRGEARLEVAPTGPYQGVAVLVTFKEPDELTPAVIIAFASATGGKFHLERLPDAAKPIEGMPDGVHATVSVGRNSTSTVRRDAPTLDLVALTLPRVMSEIAVAS